MAVWRWPRTKPKVDAISVKLTNHNVWHEYDLMRGMRDFVKGNDTAHNDAFMVFLGRCLWALLRIEKLNTHQEK